MTKTVTKESFYTVSQFARRIGIHPQSLRVWDETGKLKPHHKTPGGRRYYSEEQAVNFLTNQSSTK